MPIDLFSPAYSSNSTHTIVSPVSDPKLLISRLKLLLESCGWTATSVPARGSMIISPSIPLQSGATSSSPGPVCGKLGGDGHVGGTFVQWYDPNTQSPGACGYSVLWMPKGASPAASAGSIGAAISALIGCTFVGTITDNGNVYMLFDGGSIEAAEFGIFILGLGGGATNPTYPYYNVQNTTLSTAAVQGGGWEMLSPDGTWNILIDYRVDSLGSNIFGPYSNSTSMYLSVRPVGGTYDFIYPFSSRPSSYHLHASSSQLIIWADNIAGPSGRPTNIIISSLSIPDDIPSFIGSNLSRVLLVAGSMISPDGSFFSGDDNPLTSQVRTRLMYVRGIAEEFDSFVEGDTFSHSHAGSGPQAGPCFLMRGLDNGRDLTASNGQPLAQSPWMFLPDRYGGSPNWIVGKLWDALLLSSSSGSGLEGEIMVDNKKWKKLALQSGGGGVLNGSLWLTHLFGDQ